MGRMIRRDFGPEFCTFLPLIRSEDEQDQTNNERLVGNLFNETPCFTLDHIEVEAVSRCGCQQQKRQTNKGLHFSTTFVDSITEVN